ncbi:MAG TPA: nitroreductase [Ferruginibacter sp.]|nr:nitroreductase [Ferruginibacter sp.]
MTSTQFNELVKNRRSVFPSQFDESKKVDDAIIWQILENATWAPNHGKTEPWFFTVFTGEGLQTLANLQSQYYLDHAGESFKEDKLKKLQQQPLRASHVIALGMKRSQKKNIPEIEDVEAVACAVQNIYLSVSSYGLGGYWTTGGITYLDGAQRLFGLDEADKLLGFFYIGHVAIPSPAANRIAIDEKSEWIRT